MEYYESNNNTEKWNERKRNVLEKKGQGGERKGGVRKSKKERNLEWQLYSKWSKQSQPTRIYDKDLCLKLLLDYFGQ